ncbi:MAG: hypothetical protein KAR06_02995 [Deltaproteobacteria bacterium]|nr:hypothetical protein [Deltaproteobacteria bacterium]
MRGTGTAIDPFIIEDVFDLQNIENDLTAFYELESDIDASVTVGWNGGAGFMPIALASFFSGSLDGKGYSIINLYMNYNLGVNISMIDENRGSILNLGLVNITYLGIDPVGFHFSGGGFVRTNYGTIRNCFITGYLDGHDVGGICQTNWPLFGLPALISKCFSTCRIVASDQGGGICYSNGGTVERSYSTGQVSGDLASGLVGINSGIIQDCYSRSRVIGISNGGGLVQWNDLIIRRSYSTGAVSAAAVGGLVQGAGGASIVEDCFWDIETSGQAASAGGTGQTTAQMKSRSTFTAAGWNLNSIWFLATRYNNGYPCFQGVPTYPYIPLGGAQIPIPGPNPPPGSSPIPTPYSPLVATLAPTGVT